MFISEKAKKVNHEILTGNQIMVQNTREYVKVFQNLEQANKLA